MVSATTTAAPRNSASFPDAEVGPIGLGHSSSRPQPGPALFGAQAVLLGNRLTPEGIRLRCFRPALSESRTPENQGRPSCVLVESPTQGSLFPTGGEPQLAWYDWLCGSSFRRVVGADVAGLVGAALYNWFAGPVGAVNVTATGAAASESQDVLKNLQL